MNAQMTMASVMQKTSKTLARLNRMVCYFVFINIKIQFCFVLYSDAITRFSKNYAIV